ncbi:glycosyltransferase family 1 protein [Dyella sp. BiH032]|uniref:glycosyltransferase family 4 protein n=1 Tax=Dyella sp. BiH032 TaxID=3075430 RepID=UPI0028930B5E|nr:glycosyltransferase family 1 protein [Dyella sp. BiH032]WNL45549.1 glycosyltransferase family 1 protein [Dyella sp. BiH032]
MKVVIDLQACQSPDGSIRGVGRYCSSLALALARSRGEHEVWIAVNGAMPESVGTVRDLFAGILPEDRVIAWESLAPTASMYPENSERSLVAEWLREAFLASLGADVVLTASMVDGFVDSVVTSVPAHSAALQVAILFDLIPLAMPEVYLTRDGQSAWYMRKVDHLRRCDLLLGISESTRTEAIQMLDLAPDKVVNISAAVGANFRQLDKVESAASVGRKYGIHKPFVMYAGGFDPRKNLETLIVAYAALPASLRETHQLVMVGNIDIKERNELNAVRERAGLAVDELVFTGFVSDEDLVRLYNSCATYVFPSIHEGFGLPALEAMSCGAVVIGAAATSLPEVIGVEEALFNPHDARDITTKLQQALIDEPFRQRMREHALRHAKGFTWEESARRAWLALEEALAARVPVELAALEAVPRLVALVTLDPVQAGDVASALGFVPERLDVFGLVGDAAVPSSWRQRGLGELEPSAFDEILVHVTDSEGMRAVLDTLRGFPVTLLLGQKTLPRLFAAWAKVDLSVFVAMLYRWGGYHVLGLASGSGAESFESIPARALACLDPAWALAREASATGYSTPAVIARAVTSPGVARWNHEEIGRLSMAIAANAPASDTLRTLYVDISHLVIEDAKTGIQRVVRHIVAELLASPPSGYRVEPIYIKPDGVFRYARSYCAARFHAGLTLPEDLPVEFRQSDVFVGLDLAAHLVPYLRHTYIRMRSSGVAIHFVVYDLLPLLRPDCFDENGLPTFRLWYEAIAELADGIICISRTVADEFKRWLPQSMPARGRALKIGWFHLGADIVQRADIQDDSGDLPVDLGSRPSFLIVGTIEPRKGHAQTLSAFERLWERGHQVNLVLIGKPGWRVETLISRLRQHPEAGKRLFWLERANDSQLIAMYQQASALLAPSEGEGFGLPLIEAAQYGRPIIARDLPVFQEVAGEHAFYFSGMQPEPMADAIERWLELDRQGQAPVSKGLPWLTWKQSAKQLEEVAVGGNWYTSWEPGSDRYFAASDYRAQTTTGQLVRGQRVSLNAPGVLFATPPFKITAGDYVVRVEGARLGAEGMAWVDVEAHDGAWRLASASLAPGEGVIAEVQVRVKEDVRDLRIRIMVDADASLSFSTMAVAAVH